MEQIKQLEIHDLIKLFLSERDICKVSKDQYRFNINKFFTWVKDNGFNYLELGKADILKYKSKLIYEGKTQLTIANYMITLRLFYKWLAANDITPDLTQGIRINKSYYTFRKKSLNVKQSNNLLNSFDRSTLIGKRDYAIVNLMLRNGLRGIEVVRMNVEDVVEYNDKLAINIQRKGKLEKDSTIPLSTKAMEAIHDYLVHRPGNWQDASPLFISNSNHNKYHRICTGHITTMVKKQLNKIGITDPMVTAHSLRHTAATMLMAKGNAYDVQVFMGHRNFATTQIYTRQREREMIFTKDIIKSLDY